MQSGLAAIGQGSILVQQDFQPTQEGTPSAPTIFLHKVMDERIGAQYRVNQWDATPLATFTGSVSSSMLSVSSIASGALSSGQTLSGNAVPNDILVVGLGTGTGGTGTYLLNQPLTLAPQSLFTIAGMGYTETQQYQSTFQISALVTQDPSNTASLTASDICNYAAYVMQSLPAIQALEAMGVGILKIGQIRNPYFSDDRERWEANPSFDFVLTHKQIISSVQPVITEYTLQVLEV